MYAIEFRYYSLDPEPNADGKRVLRTDQAMMEVTQEFINGFHWALHESEWGMDDIDLHEVTDEAIKTEVGYYPPVGLRIEAKTPATDLWLRLNTPPEATIVRDDG